MKLLKLCAFAALPASSLMGNLILNPAFSEDPPSQDWSIFAGGVQAVGDFVSFAGPVATLTPTSATETNFYQEFMGSLTPGVTYTFTVDIANLDLGGGTGVVFSKGFSSAFAWLNEFPNEPLFNGTNTISFTATGDGSNVYQVGVFLLGGTGSSLEFSNPTLIPEPRTYALLFGLFGLGVVLYRRRRRQ